MNKLEFKPRYTAPDKDPADITASEVIDACNVRMGGYNPKGGASFYEIEGNVIIPNPLLPDGDNLCLGWTGDVIEKRLLYANWNSNGNHAIYSHNGSVFQVVINQQLGFNPDSEIDMDYNGGILIWTSLDIKEPRYINVDAGIRTFLGEPGFVYPLPIPAWIIHQLHLVSNLPPLFYGDTTDSPSGSSLPAYIGNYTAKPVPDVKLDGIQISFNPEFADSSEGRASDWSIVNFNNGPYVIIPDTFFDTYMRDGITPNPFIKAIRFYYRIGNDGPTIYFKRIENQVAYWLNTPPTDPPLSGYHFGFKLDPNEQLQAIGSPSLASTLGQDGIPPYVRTNSFGDNREILGNFKEGYNVVLPTGTATVITSNLAIASRNFRLFPPITYPVELAFGYYDEKDRFIGSKNIGRYTLSPHAAWSISYNDIKSDFPSIDFDTLPWNQVIDIYFDNSVPGFPYAYSRVDIENAPYLNIVPDLITGQLPPEIAKIRLLTKNHISITQGIRTICRFWFIYKGPNDELFVYRDIRLGSTDDDRLFYGIGFEVSSDEPVAFSTEQDFFISIRGTAFASSFLLDGGIGLQSQTAPVFKSEYKVTDQLGAILICKSAWSEWSPGPTGYRQAVSLQPFFTDWMDPYKNTIVDVFLYSKNSDPPISYNEIPGCEWTPAQFLAQESRNYFGDGYITADKKLMGSQNRSTLGSSTDPIIVAGDSIDWAGYYWARALTGIWVESWASDIGRNYGVLQENPEEVWQMKAFRHGSQAFQNTKINNLFAFNPLDQDFVKANYGPITKLIVLGTRTDDGENIYAVCVSGTEKIYLGKTQLTNVDGSSNLAANTAVFGNHNALQLPYGTTSQRFITRPRLGVAAYWDDINHKWVQISSNGLDAISDQRNFVKHADSVKGKGAAFFNPRYKEFGVHGEGEGFAYNFEQDLYQGRRTFGSLALNNVSEMFAFLSGDDDFNQMFSFCKGQLYIHDIGTTINGQPFETEATIVLNAEPKKKYKEIFQVGYTGTPGFSAEIFNDLGQFTTIKADEFEGVNESFFSSVKGDENSIGGRIRGKTIEASVIFVKLKGKSDEPKQIIGIELGYLVSQSNL